MGGGADIKCSAAALINLDVELAMQEQIQSLQQQLSMKLPSTATYASKRSNQSSCLRTSSQQAPPPEPSAGFHRSVHLEVAVVKGVVLAVLLLLLAGVLFAKWCSNRTNQI
ncbi:unnamed protein product [Arctogadus glacialis]